MPSIKQLSDRKFRVFAFGGYTSKGKKNVISRTVTVPTSVRKIDSYVAAYAYKLETEYKEGTKVNDNVSLAEYTENWIERQTKYKPSTLESYKHALRYICEDIGNVKLSNLRPIVIEGEIRNLKNRKHLGKTMKDVTAKKYITVLSVVLEDAVRNRYLRDNPIRWVELDTTERKEQHIPTEAEMERFVTALNDEPLVYRVFYMMAMYTGARRGELSALRWGDIKNGVMTISKSRVYLSSQGVIEGKTKNRRNRVVPIPIKIQELLDELREFQQKGRSWGGSKKDCVVKQKCKDDDYIFVNNMGIALTPNCFTRHIRKVMTRSGLSEEFHLHTLRHYYASYLLNNGVSSKIVADLLGHCDSGFLERTYGHAMPEIAEFVIRAIEGMGQ